MFMWFFLNNSKIILRCDKKPQTFSSHVGIFHNVNVYCCVSYIIRWLERCHDVTKRSIYCDVICIESSLCERIYYIRMCGFTRVNLLENDFPEIHTKREK